VRIVSVGEILWDVFPDAERLGGAPFNFAVNAHRLGHDVRFVSAVGDDDRGRRAIREAQRLGLSTDDIVVTSDAPTGRVTVAFDAAGEPNYSIHRPAAYDFLQMPASVEADWIYYGTLLQKPDIARITSNPLSLGGARRFYDVNLRPNSFTLELVRDLLAAADVVKMNEAEASVLEGLMSEHSFDAICITRGKDGCTITIGDESFDAPGIPVTGGDPVGAGDAFAAAFLHGLDAGWSAKQIANFANRAGANAARHPGAI
jgi:fructokinase